jgi:hypothetical protein
MFAWYRWFTVSGTNPEEFIMNHHHLKIFAFISFFGGIT